MGGWVGGWVGGRLRVSENICLQQFHDFYNNSMIEESE